VIYIVGFKPQGNKQFKRRLAGVTTKKLGSWRRRGVMSREKEEMGGLKACLCLPAGRRERKKAYRGACRKNRIFRVSAETKFPEKLARRKDAGRKCQSVASSVGGAPSAATCYCSPPTFGTRPPKSGEPPICLLVPAEEDRAGPRLGHQDPCGRNASEYAPVYASAFQSKAREGTRHPLHANKFKGYRYTYIILAYLGEKT
jgi:hypothetical protein